MKLLPSTKPCFSIEEVCRETTLGRSQIYEEIRSGRLPAKKCGRRTLIAAADFQRWVEGLPAL